MLKIVTCKGDKPGNFHKAIGFCKFFKKDGCAKSLKMLLFFVKLQVEELNDVN